MAQAILTGFLQMDLMVRGVIGQIGGFLVPLLAYLIITRQKPSDVLNLTIPKTKSVLLAILLGTTLVPAIITFSMLIPVLSSYVFPPQEAMTIEFIAVVP